jgi:hypothetical protein
MQIYTYAHCQVIDIQGCIHETTPNNRAYPSVAAVGGMVEDHPQESNLRT